MKGRDRNIKKWKRNKRYSSSNIRVEVLLARDPFNVFLFQENIDTLLDVGNLWLETRLELVYNFIHQLDVLERFSCPRER
jgi:hypothetical protein